MPFEYSCFISYPHGQNNVLVPKVVDFVEGLEREILAVISKSVWVDTRNLPGGSRLDASVGPEMCKSACMILIYTPLYFDAEHDYCMRELKAMHELEEQRMPLLRDKGKGLIIPIILRGVNEFPKVLKRRIAYDFTDIAFSNPENKLSVRFDDQIKKIAEYIIEIYRLLEKASPQLPQDCERFGLPTSEAAIKFVEEELEHKVTGVPTPFVTRSRKKGS